jgi:hypothetical protein
MLKTQSSTRRMIERPAHLSVTPHERLHPRNVRVLRLSSSSKDGPLHACLETVNLDALRPGDAYEAISYAWISTETPHSIEIEDFGTATITTSLFTALQNFRHQHNERRLWADALCIDQSNLDEKSL